MKSETTILKKIFVASRSHFIDMDISIKDMGNISKGIEEDILTEIEVM